MFCDFVVLFFFCFIKSKLFTTVCGVGFVVYVVDPNYTPEFYTKLKCSGNVFKAKKTARFYLNVDGY